MNEQTENWLAFAQSDLRAGEVLLPEELYSHACFQAQQAVERALKAVLVHLGQTVPRTHSIVTLAQLMPAELAASFQGDLSIFDDYYIPVRYPDALPGGLPDGPPGKQEATDALVLAGDVVETVSQYLAA
jgi:HEPN domain-containing protein